MRDHTKLRAFELADEVFLFIYQLHYQFNLANRLGYMNGIKTSDYEKIIIETEKVLGALLRSMRKP